MAPIISSLPKSSQVLDDEDDELFLESAEEVVFGKSEEKGGEETAADLDEDLLMFDEEEFEGFLDPAVEQRHQTASAAAAAGVAAAALPAEERLYILELLFIVSLLVYAANFMIGRRYNEKLARGWLAAQHAVLSSQFSHLGQITEEDIAALPSSSSSSAPISSSSSSSSPSRKVTSVISIDKVSQSQFRFFATGRRNCLGAQLTLKTLKRHDLVSVLVNLVTGGEDIVTVEVPVEPMEPCLFLCARTALVKKLCETHKELPSLSSYLPSLSKSLPAGFSVYSDSPDAAAAILADPQVASALSNFSHEIKYIYLSDQTAPAKYAKMLRCSFKLPASNFERQQPLLHAIFSLVDFAARHHPSPADKKRQAKLRAEAAKPSLKEQEEKRREELEKAQDAKREEERKRYAQMSPDQRAKYDQKIQARELKKRQNRMVRVVKA
ncbi:MAG: DUF1682 domain-containing protein [archaeon]|nr:DUF1682 domain-containing protein [archaeon]